MLLSFQTVSTDKVMSQTSWDLQEIQPAQEVFWIMLERRWKNSTLLSVFQILASKNDKFLFSVTNEK